MRVRHGAQFTVTVKADQRVLRTDVVAAEVLGAHIEVLSYCYGGAFGQANWHDGAGQSLDRPPTVTFEPVDPSDVLTGEDLCDCTDCLKEAS